MSITLLVNGVDKTNRIDRASLRKVEVLTKQANTLEFMVRQYGTSTYVPVLNDEVTFFNGATKIFGGIVTELKDTIVGQAKRTKIFCKDYTHLLDRYLVGKSYDMQPAEDVVSNIISTFTTGFTVSGVDAPEDIPAIKFNYISVSQALTKIATLLVGYEWYVDYDKDIHFFKVTENLAPFDITDSSDNYVANSLELVQDLSQIRNDIRIRGGQAVSTGTNTEYFSGDGTKLIFVLGSNFSEAPTVTVGGVGKTVGIQNVDDPADFDCLWDQAQKTLHFRGGTVPAVGVNNIVVVGTYLYPFNFQKQDNDSILSYGVFQFIIYDKNITSVETAEARADVELNDYAQPAYNGSFSTYTDGLETGQYININSTVRGINRSFKIQSITVTARTPLALLYEVNIETSPVLTMNDVLRKLLMQDIADQVQIDLAENIQREVNFDESIGSSDAVAAPSKKSPPYTWGPASSNPTTWGFGTWHV